MPEASVSPLPPKQKDVPKEIAQHLFWRTLFIVFTIATALLFSFLIYRSPSLLTPSSLFLLSLGLLFFLFAFFLSLVNIYTNWLTLLLIAFILPLALGVVSALKQSDAIFVFVGPSILFLMTLVGLFNAKGVLNNQTRFSWGACYRNVWHGLSLGFVIFIILAYYFHSPQLRSLNFFISQDQLEIFTVLLDQTTHVLKLPIDLRQPLSVYLKSQLEQRLRQQQQEIPKLPPGFANGLVNQAVSSTLKELNTRYHIKLTGKEPLSHAAYLIVSKMYTQLAQFQRQIILAVYLLMVFGILQGFGYALGLVTSIFSWVLFEILIAAKILRYEYKTVSKKIVTI